MNIEDLKEASQIARSLRERRSLLEICESTGTDLMVMASSNWPCSAAVTITADDRIAAPLKQLLAHRLREDITDLEKKLKTLGVDEMAA